MSKKKPKSAALAPAPASIAYRGGISVRLLICDTCRAVWPTEREPEHGGSRLDGEPCAYDWRGTVCRGRVHPVDGQSRKRAPFEQPMAWTLGEGTWCKTLGLPHGTRDLALVRTTYRALIKRIHPDVGGSHERMVEVNKAYTLALYELGQR